MRTVLLAVALALLFLATCAQGSLISRRNEKLKQLSQTRKLKDSNRGTGYKLVSELVAALHFKNYTWASSLLADDGFFVITDVMCDALNKTQFMGLAESNPVASSQVIFKSWVETDGGLTIITADVGALFNADSNLANTTYYATNVVYVAIPSADGTQLEALERWADTSYRQMNNASQMQYTFNQLVAGHEVRDLPTYDRNLAQGFDFTLNFPWGEYPAVHQNRSTFLSQLALEFVGLTRSELRVGSVITTCEFILADVMNFDTYADNKKHVNKFFIAATLDDSYRVVSLAEYMVGLPNF